MVVHLPTQNEEAAGKRAWYAVPNVGGAVGMHNEDKRVEQDEHEEQSDGGSGWVLRCMPKALHFLATHWAFLPPVLLNRCLSHDAGLSSSLTEEDKSRTQLYRLQKQRELFPKNRNGAILRNPQSL